MRSACAIAFAMSICPCAFTDVESVSKEAEREWLNHLVPLPHSISIPRKCVLRPEGLSIQLRKGADEVERHAALELRKLVKERTGIVPSGAAFAIVVGLLDGNGSLCGAAVRGVDELRRLPNSNQAYLIQADGDKKLLVAALAGEGLYYGVQTLRQLMGAAITKESVSVPLAEVQDWPDLDERGVWNSRIDIDWLASLKLNFRNLHARIQRFEQGKGCRAAINKDALHAARLRAFKLMPQITHLNFLHRFGLYEAYPELAGEGESAFQEINPGRGHRCPCASNPLLRRILAELMTDLASQGVREMTVWTTEFYSQCGCEKCKKEGQFVLEARAIVGAWREVREKYPGFTVRLFVGFRLPDQDMAKVLAEIPSEVKIERCCRGGVRDKPFDECAAKGHWVATYDVPWMRGMRCTVSVYKDRLRNLHERVWRGAYVMSPDREFADLLLHALAEWSWNVNGRTVRELAAAWAIRQGYASPARFAECVALIAPVEARLKSNYQNVYFFERWIKGMTDFVAERKVPRLGGGYFYSYRADQHFDRDIHACRKALEMARTLEHPWLSSETALSLSYVQMSRHVYELTVLIAKSDLAKEENKKCLETAVSGLQAAAAANADAMKLMGASAKPKRRSFLLKTVESRAKMLADFLSGVHAAIPASGATTGK